MTTVCFGNHLQNKFGVLITSNTVQTNHIPYLGENVIFGIYDFSKLFEKSRQIRKVWKIFVQPNNTYLVELDYPYKLD